METEQSWNNHELSELEIYRKDIVSKENTIQLLKQNVADQQKEIHHLQLRVKALVDAQSN